MGVLKSIIISIFTCLLVQNSALPAKKFSKEISFPFFENEFQLPDNSFEIGFGNFIGLLKISNTTVVGFNTLHIKAEIDPKKRTSSSSVTSDSELGISGNYELSLKGTTNSGLNLEFSGHGYQSNSVTKISVGHYAKFENDENGYLEISDLKITISFDSISLNFENFIINGIKIDWIWKPLTRFLNNSFNDLWLDVREPLTAIATERLNGYFQIQKITFEQFVGGLDGE